MKILLNISLKRILYIIGCLILITSLTLPPVVMGQDSSESGTIPTIRPMAEDGLYNAYIPSITKAFCEETAPSPFTVQIAGLSDFILTDGLTPVEVDQMKAVQLAEYNDAFPAMVQAVGESGAGWARVYIDWSAIQPIDPAGGPPTYNWTSYDNWMSQVISESVQIIATVSNPPEWAAVDKSPSDTCTNMIRSDKVTDFYNFLTELVNRYKAAPYNVHAWEMLNEPDAINGYRCNSGVSNYGNYGAEYASLMQSAYLTVKTADPASKVIMGGIANDLFYLPYDDNQYFDGSLAGKFNRYFIDDIMVGGAASNLDAVNFHYFQDFAPEWERWTVGGDGPPTCGNIRTPGGTPYNVYGLDLVAKGSHFLNRLNTCFNVNLPLWVTEVGMHGIDPESPYMDEELQARYDAGQTLENQARYVFKVYSRGLSLGAEIITWYAIKIIPDVTPGDFQGLVYDSRDGAKEDLPKPAFYAFQTLAQELKGFTFEETFTDTLSVDAYSFTSPCQGTKIVAWVNEDSTVYYTLNDVASIQLVYRPLAVGVQDVTIFDGDVNDLDLTVNGSITFLLGVEPVIIHPNP